MDDKDIITVQDLTKCGIVLKPMCQKEEVKVFVASICGRVDVVIDSIGTSKQIQALYPGKSSFAGQVKREELRCMEYESEATLLFLMISIRRHN